MAQPNNSREAQSLADRAAGGAFSSVTVNVDGVGLMRINIPDSVAGIEAQAGRSQARRDKWSARGQAVSDAVMPHVDFMRENPEAISLYLPLILNEKFKEVKGFVDMATQGMTVAQKAAVTTMGLNGIGDIAGLISDIEMYITDPESRTWLNATLSAAGVFGGAATIAPSMAAILPVLKKNINAWQGSPHRFTKMSSKHIGTGEGAQAYGHGLYFAENQQVAKGYVPRDFDSEGLLMDNYKAAEAANNTTAMEIYERAMTHDTSDEIADLFSSADFAPYHKAEDVEEALSGVRDIERQAEGYLYNVDLKVSPDDLLDWDAPLSEQSESVRESLLGTMKDRGFDDSQIQSFVDRDLSGEEFYTYISGIKGAEFGSGALRDRGIPGIRYYDGGSRAAGEGTRNFVIFDDSLVDIKTRNGEVLTPVQRQEAVGSMMGGRSTHPISGGTTPDPRYDSRVGEQPRIMSSNRTVEKNEIQIPDINLEDYEGRPFILGMADRTDAGGYLTGIDDVGFNSPVPMQGGQDYMFHNPGQVWAADAGPSAALLNRARLLKEQTGQNPLFMPYRMAPSGGDHATMTGESMLQYASASMNKTNKRKLDSSMKKIIPGWKGVDDPVSIVAYRGATGDQRKAALQVLDRDFRDVGGIGIGQGRLSVTDPRQINAKDFNVMNVGEINPDMPLIRESGHSTYGVGVPGEGLGRLINEFAAPRLVPEFLQRRGIVDPENLPATEMYTMRRNVLSGTISEDILRVLEELRNTQP